ITLVLAFAVFELVRYRRIRLVALTAGITFGAIFLLYRLTLYDGEGYGNQFRLTPDVWIANLVQYLKSPGSLWAPAPTPVRYLAAGSVIVLLLIGFGMRITGRRMSLGELYTVIYLGPLLVFSAGANTRYILPIYPLFLIYSALGLTFLIGQLPVGQTRRVAWAAVSVALIAGALLDVWGAYTRPVEDGPETAEFQQVVEWVRTNTGNGDAVVCWNPRVMGLYTRRLSSLYLKTRDPEQLRQFLRDIKASAVVSFSENESDVKWLIPQLTANPDLFVSALQTARFAVYRVNPAK
ncbi:MAG: hypothetical protein H7Y20_04255, partial [Bryobacteraceae bacterium]|nr:hypothetical protein [Bryobacteraceae bacterium]